LSSSLAELLPNRGAVREVALDVDCRGSVEGICVVCVSVAAANCASEAVADVNPSPLEVAVACRDSVAGTRTIGCIAAVNCPSVADVNTSPLAFASSEAAGRRAGWTVSMSTHVAPAPDAAGVGVS